MDFTAPGTTATADPFGDPDLDNLDAPEATSDLDDIAAELTAEVAPTTTIVVEGRPDYAVRYRTNITAQDLDSLRKRAKNKRFSDGIDTVKFSSLLLAFTAQAIIRKGTDLELDGVTPVTFTTRELQAVYGTGDADTTVRKFFGLEGHVDAAARKLLTEAGWGDEADTADPTQ